MKTVKEIKSIVKSDLYSELQNYVVDDITLEELSDKEKDIFWREYEKILNRLLKTLS